MIGELRALEVFSTVPAGCILQCVSNDHSDPHLRIGEFAVTDTTDTEPQNGEVYLIKWLSGGTDIVQAFTRAFRHPDQGELVGWWTRCLNFKPLDEALNEARKRGGIPEISATSYVDGPRMRDTFQQALIGRVIGIYQPVDLFAGSIRQIGSNRQ